MGRGKMGPEERKHDFYVNIFFFPYLVFVTTVYPSCISLDYLSYLVFFIVVYPLITSLRFSFLLYLLLYCCISS